MIITVKNLQQQTFTIDIGGEKTVLQLKEQIYLERGSEYVVEKQKLIYAGIILDDERTIASYNVDEKKFVVVLVRRDLCASTQKPDSGANADSSHAETHAIDETSTVAGDNTGHSTEDMDTTSDGSNRYQISNEECLAQDEDANSIGSGDSGGGTVLGPVGSNISIRSSASGVSLQSGGSGGTYSSGDLAGVFSNTSLQTRAESNLLMGIDYNITVESMIEMGYSRERVVHAMTASFNNPERAVEYLISGIPDEEDLNPENVAAAAEGVANDERSAADGSVDRIGNQSGIAVGGGGDGGIGVRSAVPGIGGDGGNVIGILGAAPGDGGDGSYGVGIQGAAPSASVPEIAAPGGAVREGSAAHGVGGGEGIAAPGGGDGGGIVAPGGGDGEGIAVPGGGGGGEGIAAPGGAGAGIAARRNMVEGGDIAAGQHDPFEFLRDQPQFVQMRSLVSQNPDLLHAVLQQIGRNNPALLQLISDNQDAFLRMLNQPVGGRLMTPGRRAQLARIARAAASGDGPHVRPLDIAPGAGGDGPPARQRPPESGDAGADTIPYDQLPPRPDRAAERRAAAVETFMRERAAAAVAIAELSAATAAALDSDSSDNADAACSVSANVSNDRSGDANAVTASTDAAVDNSHAERSADDGMPVGGDLTEEDRDAIERLKALGFPELLVLQAYIACEKDEQLAANFLINSTFDE